MPKTVGMLSAAPLSEERLDATGGCVRRTMSSPLVEGVYSRLPFPRRSSSASLEKARNPVQRASTMSALPRSMGPSNLGIALGSQEPSQPRTSTSGFVVRTVSSRDLIVDSGPLVTSTRAPAIRAMFATSESPSPTHTMMSATCRFVLAGRCQLSPHPKGRRRLRLCRPRKLLPRMDTSGQASAPVTIKYPGRPIQYCITLRVWCAPVGSLVLSQVRAAHWC